MPLIDTLGMPYVYGIGSYHGKTSFETFSNMKSTVVKSSLFDLDLLYPPYSKTTLKLIRKIMK
jgi:aldehyde dehydrogenase (NAD+)